MGTLGHQPMITLGIANVYSLVVAGLIARIPSFAALPQEAANDSFREPEMSDYRAQEIDGIRG
jgi:hypothetical protein